MVLLDTNVISEPLKPQPHPAVLAWINAQPIETLYLSAISLAELRFGIAILPDGKHKNGLQQRLNERVMPMFENRILVFDADAATTYAELCVHARAAGKAIDKTDGYIAAIAAAHGLTVATRDVSPFRAAGLDVIDPWNTGP